MINALGVVGWGVGGIEAEAGMLGQPIYFLTPDVVGVKSYWRTQIWCHRYRFSFNNNRKIKKVKCCWKVC